MGDTIQLSLPGQFVNFTTREPLGVFADRAVHHQSIARIFTAATITPAGDHPGTRGWREFTIHDEPYINSYFGPDGNQPAANVTPIAVANRPPEVPMKGYCGLALVRCLGSTAMSVEKPPMAAARPLPGAGAGGSPPPVPRVR